MTRFVLRLDGSTTAPADAVVLDWLPEARASTVQANRDLLAGLDPPSAALDLLSLGVAAYCADRLEVRPRRQGRWGRDLRVDVPVFNRESMRHAEPALKDALDFLTGDDWSLRFKRRAGEPASGPDVRNAPVDAVCLFSGGLDSLAGAIQLLEGGSTVCLLSHYEGGLAPSRQSELAQALASRYGSERVQRRTLFLRPAPFDPQQDRPLSDERENTTRGRSFLFLAAGVAVAAGYGTEVPLFIPENGLIGINVPLSGARPASLSTRTTHPHFMRCIAATLDAVALKTRVENPFRLSTKGETLARSPALPLLKQLAPRSLSCAHPEAGRLHHRSVGNCGYCFPCLIRRASLHHIGADRGSQYAIDAAADPSLLDLEDAGADLRALLFSLSRPASELDVLRNGPVPGPEVAAFAATHIRGRGEIRGWLRTKGHRRIRAALAKDVL